MHSSVALRRLAALRTARLRRNYATQPEPDPQLNGYPQLPWVSRQELPALGWQDRLYRRNFGDTLHEQDEVLSMWGPDPAPLPPATALRQFLIATAGFISFGFLVKAIVPDAPSVPREYPYDGLVKELGGLEENKARTESAAEEE